MPSDKLIYYKTKYLNEMASFRYYKITKTKKIRYISNIYKNSLCIVFLHGFMSDLEGEKPRALLNFAKKLIWSEIFNSKLENELRWS